MGAAVASYSIADLGAIGAFHRGKLKAAGIRSTAKFLERTGTVRLRKQLAEATGIPVEKITYWAHIADLMRIHGVAADYAELLAAAGAGTVRELRRRSPANTVARMAAVNGRRKYVDLLPSESRVDRWIKQAKSLKPSVTY
jgi:hypothetical protein